MSGVYVRVRVGAEHYAFAVREVLEVAEIGEVTPVPGASAALLGVRNLRGQILPVADLGAVLGVPAQGGSSRLVVAEAAGRRAGFAVDALTTIGELPDASEQPGSPYLSGAALHDGDLIGLIDLPAALASIGTTEEQP